MDHSRFQASLKAALNAAALHVPRGLQALWRPAAVASSMHTPLPPAQTPGFPAATALSLTPFNGTSSEQELDVHVHL